MRGYIMRKLLINRRTDLGDNKELVICLWKVDKSNYFPEGLEFACQFLYLKDSRYVQVARIDNQLHKGRPGTHIHILRREKVEWTNISFKEAEAEIEKIGERVIRNIIERI